MARPPPAARADAS